MVRVVCGACVAVRGGRGDERKVDGECECPDSWKAGQAAALLIAWLMLASCCAETDSEGSDDEGESSGWEEASDEDTQAATAAAGSGVPQPRVPLGLPAMPARRPPTSSAAAPAAAVASGGGGDGDSAPRRVGLAPLQWLQQALSMTRGGGWGGQHAQPPLSNDSAEWPPLPPPGGGPTPSTAALPPLHARPLPPRGGLPARGPNARMGGALPQLPADMLDMQDVPPNLVWGLLGVQPGSMPLAQARRMLQEQAQQLLRCVYALGSGLHCGRECSSMACEAQHWLRAGTALGWQHALPCTSAFFGMQGS